MLSKISVTILVLSFIMSTIALASTYYEKHIKTKCYLRWVNLLHSDQMHSQLTIDLLVSNMSSRPSTITNVAIWDKREYHESTWYPVLLLGQDKQNKFAYSDSTPLNIPSRSAKYFVLTFQYLPSFTLGQTLHLKLTIDERQIFIDLPVELVAEGDQFTIALSNRMH